MYNKTNSLLRFAVFLDARTCTVCKSYLYDKTYYYFFFVEKLNAMNRSYCRSVKLMFCYSYIKKKKRIVIVYS